MAVWKLNPSFNFDGKIGNVELLNGAVKIRFNTRDENDISIKYMPAQKSGLSDSKVIDVQKVNTLDFKFNTGNFNFSYGNNANLTWDCDNGRKHDTPLIKELDNNTSIDFSNVIATSCNIQLPANVKINITGINGVISINKPISDTTAALTNGVIGLHPNLSSEYDFKLQVKNGVVDQFPTPVSSTKNVTALTLSVENGKIVHN